jgi:hypothetical protein
MTVVRPIERRFVALTAAVSGVLLIFCAGCGKRSLGPGVGGALPPKASLDLTQIPLYPQELDKWCWAASGQMVLKYRNKNVAQCVQANYWGFTGASCCPGNPLCNQLGWPDKSFDKNQTDYQILKQKALSLEALEEEIAVKHNPVAFSWRFKQGDGHMMVAVGYHTVQNDVYIDVLDPWPPKIGGSRTTMTYDEYNASEDHDHWNDFYDFKDKP